MFVPGGITKLLGPLIGLSVWAFESICEGETWGNVMDEAKLLTE